jgi:hypothetical protein
MTVTLDLKPELDALLQDLARASGLTVEEYLQRWIEESVPPRDNRSAVALLERWAAEDSTQDPAELESRRSEWRAFKAAMNEAHSSDRILYP